LEGTYILSRSRSIIAPAIGISLRIRKSWLRQEGKWYCLVLKKASSSRLRTAVLTSLCGR